MQPSARVPTVGDIREAARGLEGRVLATPLVPSESLTRLTGVPVYLKLESLQRTGSFKVRGAFHRLAALTPAERRAGVVACSAGNHALGVAAAAAEIGISAAVVMPERAAVTKIHRTRALGARVVRKGVTLEEAFVEATEIARREGRLFVHPFDDPLVIAGQATVGLEIREQAPEARLVVAPVGGGGLAAGLALALRGSGARVVGVEARGAASAWMSSRAGRPVPVGRVSTIADGIAVRRIGDLPFRVFRDLGVQVVRVTDQEIGHAIYHLIGHDRLVAEPAGAAGVAAVLFRKIRPAPGPIVVVVSGGNIDLDGVGEIVARGLVEEGRISRFLTILPDRPGALHELTGVLAERGANIVAVSHQRVRPMAEIGRVEVDVTVETEDRGHVRRLLAGLARAGFAVEPEPPGPLGARASSPARSRRMGRE